MKKIAVVGCTGAVGITMLELLENSGHTVRCMASSRSANQPLKIGQAHFDRWLALWSEAAHETMPPGLADHVSKMAGNMSHCWGRALESMLTQQAP